MFIYVFGQSYDVEVKVEVILVTRFSYMDYLLYNLMSDYILTSIKIYNITYWSLLQSIRPLVALIPVSIALEISL